MCKLVKDRVASGGKILVDSCADIGVAVGSGLAAPALQGGVVVSVGGIGSSLGRVIEQVPGTNGSPELGAYLDFFHRRSASRRGISHKDATIRAVWGVGTFELDGISVVGAGDSFHHILKVGQLLVGLVAAKVVRETFVVGGNVLSLVGEGDGVCVGLLEDALHGRKAVIRIISAAGRRSSVAAVSIADLPLSSVETTGTATKGGASQIRLCSLRYRGGCGGDGTDRDSQHLNRRRSVAVGGRQNNRRARIQRRVAADIRSGQVWVISIGATIAPSVISKIGAQASGTIRVGGMKACGCRTCGRCRAVAWNHGGFGITYGWSDSWGATPIGQNSGNRDGTN